MIFFIVCWWTPHVIDPVSIKFLATGWQQMCSPKGGFPNNNWNGKSGLNTVGLQDEVCLVPLLMPFEFPTISPRDGRKKQNKLGLVLAI